LLIAPDSSSAAPETSALKATGVAVAEILLPDAGEAFAETIEPAKPAAPVADNLDELRMRVVQALDAQGHQTASALMAAGGWQLDGNAVVVQVGVKKLMLGLVMNPEAEKIARGVMREMGFAGKFIVVPGEGTGTQAAPGAARIPQPQGSVQELALENPLVKQAQELFRAEVRSILDLRDKR
jgi:DNA polymerase-3 subunit gamma/tau